MLGIKKDFPISFRVAGVFKFRVAKMIHLGLLSDAGYEKKTPQLPLGLLGCLILGLQR